MAQAQKSTKDLIRRQDEQTVQEDKEIENMIVAKEERGRVRRMEEREKDDMDSIKGVIQRGKISFFLSWSRSWSKIIRSLNTR